MSAAALGEMHAASFAEDPKHLGFVLARYKFVAKMLAGKGRVLEIGCGDTTGARVVRDHVTQLEGVDQSTYLRSEMTIPVQQLDAVEDELPNDSFDAIYALDVLEHVEPKKENQFLYNVVRALTTSGVFIVGTPSLESQRYASVLSKKYHVNCKTEREFRLTLEGHFRNVFVLGMNDEALHCGFGPMTHYRLAICTV
jgi:SAM-dependent methyltransferase